MSATPLPLARVPTSWRWLAGQALTLLLLIGIGAAALRFTLGEPPVPLIWPGSGVALAMIYRLGNATIGVVAVATAILHLGFGTGPTEAVLLGATTGFAGWAGATLLRRCGFDRRLRRLRDVALLVIVGGGVTSFVGGAGGTLAMIGLAENFPEILGICWAADAIGLLLIAPVLFAVDLHARPTQQELQSGLWVVGGAAIVFVVYGTGMPETIALPLSYVVFPYIMLVALRSSSAITILSVAAMAAVALHCTASDKGPFALAGMPLDVFSLHAQLAILALTALVLCGMRAERDAAEQRSREHLSALARAGRLDAMSMMAAGIAHQINQPLCAVTSYAQAARRILRSGQSTEDLDRALERIIAGNEKASDIVRRIRTFLRSGESERSREDARALIHDSAELVRPEFRRHKVLLHVHCSEQMLPVDVDAVAIRQVLVNLLQNALESVLAGDSSQRGQIWLSARRLRHPERIEIVVADNGVGLPAGDRERLFEPLVTHRPEGTGLGLAIARSLVEAHEGVLTAEDREPRGAQMRIQLPLAEAKSEG